MLNTVLPITGTTSNSTSYNIAHLLKDRSTLHTALDMCKAPLALEMQEID